MNWPLFLTEGAAVAALTGYLLHRRGVIERWRRKGKEEELSVTIGRQHVWYRAGQGKGPTVLLLHGFAGDKEQWSQVARLLGDKGYHVVAPDLPGLGSNYHDPEAKYDAPTLARQLRTFARHAGLGMFHLVGHSVGAVVAASYAYAFPVEVASLTLIEPFGIKVPGESDFDRQVAAGRNPLLPTSAAGYDALLAFVAVKPPTMTAADKKRRSEDLAGNRSFYGQVWAELCQGDRAHLLDMLLPEIQVRALGVFGAASRVVHPNTAKMMERRMAAAQTVVLPECGHWPMVEQPQALVDTLTTFFRAARQKAAAPAAVE